MWPLASITSNFYRFTSLRSPRIKSWSLINRSTRANYDETWLLFRVTGWMVYIQLPLMSQLWHDVTCQNVTFSWQIHAQVLQIWLASVYTAWGSGLDQMWWYSVAECLSDDAATLIRSLQSWWVRVAVQQNADHDSLVGGENSQIFVNMSHFTIQNIQHMPNLVFNTISRANTPK